MKKLIVGNWKMYPTLSDSIVLAGSVRSGLEGIGGVQVVIAPPISWLVPVIEHWKRSLPNVHFGAQNIWPDDQGAFTGEVSAYMLKHMVKYAIVGHSERRNAGEDDDLISRKVSACLRWRIKPILCVGETRKMISGETVDQNEWRKVSKQLSEGLSGVKKDSIDDIVIAYEPVWAIGSSNPATPEYCLKVVERIRSNLKDKYGSAADMVQILYGGSVESSNAAEYLRHPEIAGLLVGGASVKAKEFINICRAASSIK